MFFTPHQSCQKVAEIPNVMRCNKVALSYSQLFEKILKSWYLQIRQIRNVTCLCRSVVPPGCALQSSHTLAAIPFLCFWIQNSSLFLERNSLFPQIYATHLGVWHKHLVVWHKYLGVWHKYLGVWHKYSNSKLRQAVLKINPNVWFLFGKGPRNEKRVKGRC